MTLDLFAADELPRLPLQPLYADAWLLRDFLGARESELIAALRAVLTQARLRRMLTPGGQPMSVSTSSCGQWGWVSDRRGYRYAEVDPHSGRPWPAMPPLFCQLAQEGAARVGFDGFEPDACLINCYRPGAKMGLHQDKDEQDFSQPIVSLSLGLPAQFLFGGFARRERPLRVWLQHGDLLVWGGEARLRYHGVAPLKPGHHASLGERRINLTFRRAH